MERADNLAVKMRPVSFDYVVGQDAAVAICKSIVKSPRSAIMFTGMYGTGKTTMARILARQLNCPHGGCGECEDCLYTDYDVTEHDAASKGVIAEIRNLIELATSSPMRKYRVIILDEVHTLRDASEQALLKALEEVPARTVWILCTTNPEKVSPTLRSRCLTINLKPIHDDVIYNELCSLWEEEGQEVTDEVAKDLNTIAQRSFGSMRTAVSTLDLYMMAYMGGTKPDALSLVAGDDNVTKLAAKLVAATVANDVKSIVGIVKQACDARGLIARGRWTIDNALSYMVGTSKWASDEAKTLVKIPLPELVRVQYLLTQIELKLGISAVDDNVMLYSMLAGERT